MRQMGKGIFLAFLIVLFALSLSIKADNTSITASSQQAPVSFGGKSAISEPCHNEAATLQHQFSANKHHLCIRHGQKRV